MRFHQDWAHLKSLWFTPSRVIDASVLEIIDTLDNPEDQVPLVESIVETFFKISPTLMAQSQSALLNKDYLQLRRQIHNLKSSSANMGAKHLAKMCLELEVQCASEELNPTEELAQSIEDQLFKIKLEFQVVLKDLEDLLVQARQTRCCQKVNTGPATM